MMIQVDFWHLVGLLITFFGFVGAGAKLLLAQVERRIDQRFERLATIEETVARHGERLARVESDVENAPDHDDLVGIHRRIDDMVREIGRLPGIERLLHDINDYLMKEGKK